MTFADSCIVAGLEGKTIVVNTEKVSMIYGDNERSMYVEKM